MKYTFSSGTTPENIIRQCLPDLYHMELNRQDQRIFEILQNIGIDSHLEAILLEKRDGYIKDVYTGKMVCNISKDGMICFLRRLIEHDFEDESLNDNAYSLRSGILETIGIEEV